MVLGDSTQSLKMFCKVTNETKQMCLLLRASMHAPWIPKSISNGKVGMSFRTSWPLRASRPGQRGAWS